MRKMDLCGRCAALMSNTYDLRKVAGGADNKVTCANCGRRRYGGTCETAAKRRRMSEKGGARREDRK